MPMVKTLGIKSAQCKSPLVRYMQESAIHAGHRDNRCKYVMECTVSDFNEFKPRLKSPMNRFQLSTGLNLEKLNTILSETNHI